MNVTREVILDLWPAYLSGDASPDTRALVEQFLRGDPEFSRRLHDEPRLPVEVSPLRPDHELQTLHRVRVRLYGYPWLLMFALMFSAVSFGRIVSDTSWDVSPRNFIVTAGIAAAFWIAYLVSLWRMRARILIVPGRPR